MESGALPPAELDAADLRVIRTLAQEGRLTMVELAERVGLSATAVQRRVKWLEGVGIIAGYGAALDFHRLGYTVEAFVKINIERQSKEAADAFRDAVRAVPGVRACWLLSGEADFMLHVIARDLPAFTRLALDELIALPGVKDMRSSIVLETVKEASRWAP
jgi:Lrp/AsnC family transcriptional regulator, leucine-responsive regulatory protein